MASGENLTPMMKQFYSVKAQHPEALLLFRCGDFYETYGEDAVTASKILGIVLTRRSNVVETAMAGFPYHSIETYLPKLVLAGYKVAVCDQLEDPKLAKNIVKRGVTELVTPGVALNEQLLRQNENNYIASICVGPKDRYGIAFLDISTGSFQVSEGSLDYLSTLLGRFAPKELLLPREYEKSLRDLLPGSYYISTLEEWAFIYDNAVEKLKSQLQAQSLKGYAVDRAPLGITAAGALLIYLEQTQPAGMKNICSISRIDEGQYVWMDLFTLRNLEVFHSSAGREGVALVDVLDRAASPMGTRELRKWLSLPILDTAELDRRYDTVDFFRLNPDILSALREKLADLGDIERLVARAAAGKIAPRATRQLGRGLGSIRPILDLCKDSGCEALEELLSQVNDCEALARHILSVLCEEPAAMLGKGDIIAPGVNEELDSLRRLSREGKQVLLDIQQREIERTGIPSLKVGYNNVFGYYLEVRNGHKDKVPQEWVRKQTLVGSERYITDELKHYEEQILGAEERIYVLEAGIYNELIARIQTQIAAIQADCRILARLDLLSSFAFLAIHNDYCRPTVDSSRVIDIKEGRHPVIESLMEPGEAYIPNDVFLDSKSQQIILLTGPNMAGKSALLRQTALIVLMAQIGCFVPAKSARIGWCDKIFTRVGASDNISRGESTFMVEMLETSMILHNLSERSLVLLDEIGRGTATFDGMSIARGIVEYIHEYGKGAKTLFATHYHELNDMEGVYPRVKNFHVTVKEASDKVIFLRKIAPGGVEKSFGIHVARMAGMPREVIASAQKTLKSLEQSDAGRPKEKMTKPYHTAAGRVESDGALQLSFFQLDDPTLGALREKLAATDLNRITPLEAFDLLREMKAEVGLSEK
ncbi:MAG: DNA mismatch repair protein MutS [Bacteroidales bacterium]|nr:DNA mismatch repair protein MutS [Bacteroidales bacterium]